MTQTTATGLPTIGEVIRAWRIFHELSSGELAEKAGVRSQYLSEIEHNRTTNPQEEYLVKLANALEVPLQDIYGRQMPRQKAVRHGRAVKSGAQVKPTRIPSITNRAMAIPWKAIPNAKLDTTEEKSDEIGGLIAAAGLSEEEEGRVTATLFEIAKQLLSLIAPQCKTRKED